MSVELTNLRRSVEESLRILSHRINVRGFGLALLTSRASV